MCLAIPGKILEIDDNSALIDFDGIKQKVIIALIQNPEIGKYVIVHAGYAIEMMNEKDALEAIEQWNELAEEQNLDLS
ncbi:MAG: HypC/HybG/HupF family hydrogenase formation chaperone, partial [Candidatus Lokiarchaeota archaeon]|nr:HypC/HybG/HupF family hydrogenase formation chaperone [Candidatus Lokiarchaeota archaeon]